MRKKMSDSLTAWRCCSSMKWLGRLLTALPGFVPALAVVAAAGALALSSCATVNRLDEFDVENATVAGTMRVPPDPTVQVSYWVDVHRRSPLLTWLSIGTTIATAGQAQAAEGRMHAALQAVDVPTIILDRGLTSCAKALDARKVRERRDADFQLNFDIREYGIRATSPLGSVMLHVRLVATLYHVESREIVWRRDIEVDDPATPVMFGFGSIVGNVVTAEALSELSTPALEAGFEQLADSAARSVARALEEDLYEVRYRK